MSRTDWASTRPARDPERGWPRLPQPGSAAGPRSRRQCPGWQRATRKGRRVQDGSGNWPQAQPLLHGDAAQLAPRVCSGRWSGRAPGSGISISEIRRAGLAANRNGVFAGGLSTAPGAGRRRTPKGSSGKTREREGLRVTWPHPLGTPRGVEPLHPWPADPHST